MEGEKLEIVVSSSTHHSQPDDDQWLRSMTIKGGKNQQKPPLIPKVPLKFRQVIQNRDCYDPSVVSIGPYHHWNEGLQEMAEGLKFDLACKFVKDSEGRPEEMYRKVKQEAKDARKCYTEDKATKRFDEEQFCKMMFIDGCFILQFIYYFLHEPENLVMSNHEASLVTKDLFLLENQLPFVVLESLLSFRARESKMDLLLQKFCKHVRAKPALGRRESFRQKILKLYGKLSKALTGNFSKGLDEQTQPTHLLQFFHTLYVHSCVSDDHPSGKKRRKPMYHYSKRRLGHGLYYSAKKLKKAGILFRPRWTAGAITDVKFKSSVLSGIVEVPPIIIDESTESLLLNLVAYESAAALDPLWVSSYILFMDSLIDDAEDVEELRSNGIIINYLGADQKVASLFNDMGKSMTHDTAAYNDVKMAINKQCESIVKRWVYEWKTTYFRNPWTFITVLAASFGLGLTATQTYYTRFPPK